MCAVAHEKADDNAGKRASETPDVVLLNSYPHMVFTVVERVLISPWGIGGEVGPPTTGATV